MPAVVVTDSGAVVNNSVTDSGRYSADLRVVLVDSGRYSVDSHRCHDKF